MSLINVQQKTVNLLIFIAAIILIATRHFDFFINPRFWAEEGTVYFLDAYTNGISALWHPQIGYYSVIPNFATYFATLVPLESAPVITTAFAFLVHVIPFYLIYISRSDYLNTSLKKLLTSLVVLFVSHPGEIWLNTITSQFHFVIITFILLLDTKDDMSRIKTYLFYLLALVSGLSGIPANILAPLFLYKYFTEKQRADLYIFGILVLTTFVQIASIIISSGLNRLEQPTYDLIGNIFISTFQYPIFHTSSVGLATICLLPLIYIIVKYLSQKKYFVIFFGTTFLLAAIMISTSLGMAGGGRYIYAPNVIFILGLLTAVFDASLHKIIRGTLIVYIAIAIFFGVKNFPLVDGGVYSTDWKNWREEVILYKAGSIDKLAVYPQWNQALWSVTLPRK